MLSQRPYSKSVTKHMRLQTSTELFINFKCTIQWENNIGHLVCTETNHITDSLNGLPSNQTSLINTEKRLKESEKSLNTSVRALSLKKH